GGRRRGSVPALSRAPAGDQRRLCVAEGDPRRGRGRRARRQEPGEQPAAGLLILEAADGRRAPAERARVLRVLPRRIRRGGGSDRLSETKGSDPFVSPYFASWPS